MNILIIKGKAIIKSKPITAKTVNIMTININSYSSVTVEVNAINLAMYILQLTIFYKGEISKIDTVIKKIEFYSNEENVKAQLMKVGYNKFVLNIAEEFERVCDIDVKKYGNKMV